MRILVFLRFHKEQRFGCLAKGGGASGLAKWFTLAFDPDSMQQER